MDGDNLRRRVYQAVKRAGIRQVRFHDLRHRFASLLIQNGESLAYVRDQLGHSSIQVMVDIYDTSFPARTGTRSNASTQPSATPAHQRVG